MATFTERVKRLRERLKEAGTHSKPVQLAKGVKAITDFTTGAVLGGAVVATTAFTGRGVRTKGQRLTKAEKKEMRQQGYSTRRGVREPSTLVRAKKTRIKQAVSRVQTGSMAYQNVRQDSSPQPKGITAPVEQPIGMDAMLPMDALREQRTVFLAEPERFKTHRSYGAFDFIGKNSKRGATMYQWDLDELYR